MRILKFGSRGKSETWGLVRLDGRDRLVRASRTGSQIVVTPVGGELPAAGTPRPRSDWSISRRAVVYPLQDLSLRHERLSLPPMSAALIDQAVRQHCAPMRDDAHGLEVSYTADKGPKHPTDLLVAWTQGDVVEAAMSALAEDGYRVQRLVTPAVALVGLLRAAGNPLTAEGSTVLVHIGERIGTAACYTDGYLVLGREFLLSDAPPGGDADPDARTPEGWEDSLENILDEVSRSILLFNHRLHGKRVARILLSSDLLPAETLAPHCAERFEVPVGLLVDELRLDLTAFGEGEAAAHAAAPWILAIAAAVVGLAETPNINLLPRALVARARRRRMAAAAAGMAMFLLLGMAGYHLSYLMTTSSILRDLRAHVALAEATDRAVESLDDLRGSRLQARQRLDMLAGTQRPAATLHGVLRALSGAATDSLHLDALELRLPEEGDQARVIEVRGRVASHNSADAQKQFILFHDRLRADPLLQDARLGPLEIETVIEGTQSVLRFELLAQLPEAGEVR